MKRRVRKPKTKAQREAAAAKRRECRAKGICPNCTSRPMAPNRAQCEPCLIRARKKDKKARDRKTPARRALNLCSICGAEAVPGRRMCGFHQELICERNQTRRARWVKEGRCSQCGNEPHPGKTRCLRCLEFQRQWFREWRRNKKLAAEAGVVTLRVTPDRKSLKKTG